MDRLVNRRCVWTGYGEKSGNKSADLVFQLIRYHSVGDGGFLVVLAGTVIRCANLWFDPLDEKCEP